MEEKFMESNIYGYARVSTRDQNESRQLLALEAFGVESKKIYLDKLSGLMQTDAQ